MPIQKLKDGTYRAVVVLDWRTGKRKTKRARTKAEANEKLVELLREIDAMPQYSPNPERIVLEDWVASWLADLAVADNTKALRRGFLEHLGKLLSVPLGKLDADAITVSLRKIKTARNRRGAYDSLKQALTAAQFARLLQVNPMDAVERPEYEAQPIEPFTRDEVRAILKATRGHRFEALFVLAFATGLRGGECWGLEWSDWEDDNTLRIRRQAVERGGQVIVKAPKTRAGVRTIVIPEAVQVALLKRKQTALSEGNSRILNVFCTAGGHIQRRSNFAHKLWKPLLRELGIRERGWHHVRHTAATMLLNDGVPVHVVSKLLGHKSAKVTLDTYAHLMTDQLDVAAASMERLVG